MRIIFVYTITCMTASTKIWLPMNTHKIVCVSESVHRIRIFLSCMNDEQFRAGLAFADASRCTKFEKLLFFMVKHKLYLAFAFWIWK